MRDKRELFTRYVSKSTWWSRVFALCFTPYAKTFDSISSGFNPVPFGRGSFDSTASAGSRCRTRSGCSICSGFGRLADVRRRQLENQCKHGADPDHGSKCRFYGPAAGDDLCAYRRRSYLSSWRADQRRIARHVFRHDESWPNCCDRCERRQDTLGVRSPKFR